MSTLNRYKGSSGKFLQVIDIDTELIDLLVNDEKLVNLLAYENPFENNPKINTRSVLDKYIMQRLYLHEVQNFTHSTIYLSPKRGSFSGRNSTHNWTIRIAVPNKQEIVESTGQRRYILIAQRVTELVEQHGLSIGVPTVTDYISARLSENYILLDLNLMFYLDAGRQYNVNVTE